MNTAKAFPSRKSIIYILAALNFVHIVDSMLIMPLGDTFISEFEISSREYSILVSSYSIAAFVSSLVGFFYIDRYDRKTALLFIYVGFGLGTLACAYTDTYIQLVSLRIVTGFFGGIIGAMILSIISDLFKFKERGTALGILFGAFSAASALGVPIGIVLADKGEWQLPFMVLGLVALALAVVVYFIFPTMKEHLEGQSQKMNFVKTITNITSDQNQLYALLAGFVLVMAHFMIIPFISPYLIRNVGLTQSEIAMQFFFGGVATIISAPIIGRMTDKYGVMRVFIIVMLISFIPTILITHLQVVPLAVALTYTTMFFVFASGRMISPNTIITAAASQENRGSFMSMKSAMQQLAVGLTAFISGSIVVLGDDGLYHNYPIVGYISIALAIITIFILRKLKVAKGN